MDNFYDNLMKFHVTVLPEEVALIDDSLEELALSLSWDPEGQMVGIVPAALKGAVEMVLDRPLVWEPLENRDWLEEEERNLPPFEIGAFFLYGPHFTGKIPAGKIPLPLRSSHAFGSGQHPTTKNCLILLQALENIEKALDIGCGSGVLGLAAVKLFNARLWACDLDPESVRLAKENGLQEVVESNGLEHPLLQQQAPYDLVMANIHSGPLCAMAQEIGKVCGAHLILSGILEEQAEDVLQAYLMLGFTVKKRIDEDSWVSLLLTK